MNWSEYILTPQINKFKYTDERQKKVPADLHGDIKKKKRKTLGI